MDIEEDEIIQEIKNAENIKKYTEDLINKYIELYPSRKIFLESVNKLWPYNNIKNCGKELETNRKKIDYDDPIICRKDSELTKRLLYICSNYEIDKSIYLKLINGLMERQNHHNILFIERAALISTALFKIDDFKAQKTSCFETYKKYLNFSFAKKSVQCKIENYKYVDNKKYIKYKFNHSFTIQDFLIALKNKEWDEIKKFTERLEEILNRTSTMTFERYSDDIFDQLHKIQDLDFVDYQVKGLANIISRSEKHFDILNKMFFETKLETLKFLIVSTFCTIDEMKSVDRNVKYQMHLKFTEKFISQDYDFSSIIWEIVEKYLQYGMGYLN